MTESDWLAAQDPLALLSAVAPDWVQGGNRRVTLVGCAAVRRIWHLLRHPALRALVEFQEVHAGKGGCEGTLQARQEEAMAALDEVTPKPPTEQGRIAAAVSAAHLHGNATAEEVKLALAAATESYVPLVEAGRWPEPDWCSYYAAMSAAHCSLPTAALGSAATAVVFERMNAGDSQEAVLEVYQREPVAQADLCREVFGNPFHARQHNGLPIARLSAGARDLAAQIAKERSFHLLPQLADRLEREGISSPDLLAHLRHGTCHASGCWALDLVCGHPLVELPRGDVLL